MYCALYGILAYTVTLMNIDYFQLWIIPWMLDTCMLWIQYLFLLALLGSALKLAFIWDQRALWLIKTLHTAGERGRIGFYVWVSRTISVLRVTILYLNFISDQRDLSLIKTLLQGREGILAFMFECRGQWVPEWHYSTLILFQTKEPCD